MKRKVVIIILSVLLTVIAGITFSGCKVYHWKIEKNIEEIECIEIIYINDFYNNDYDLICEISDKQFSEIVKDIENLEAKKYAGSLTNPHNKTVRITFVNGDYDLISEYEPRHLYNGEAVSNSKTTRLCFSEEEFNRLIEKWIAD